MKILLESKLAGYGDRLFRLTIDDAHWQHVYEMFIDDFKSVYWYEVNAQEVELRGLILAKALSLVPIPADSSQSF